MSGMNHPFLGGKVAYDSLNAKQQESYNLQKVSSILAEYGYLVIKLSDDWNGADFIALGFESDKYPKEHKFLKVQLKGRLGFFKKYLNKDLYICFYYQKTESWYLYPHDKLCEMIMKKHEDTIAWKNEEEYHFPNISKEYIEILEEYKI